MKRTSLYRHFDASGKLLYVGISASFMARLCQHSSTSHWYWRIAKVEVEHFKTRAHAQYAEALAIRDEGPLYNKAKPVPRNPDIPIPKLVMPPPAPVVPDTPRKIGYICAESRFVGPQSVGLRHVGVPDALTFVDVLEEVGDERPMLIRMAKTAQHAGTEVYHLHSSAIPQDLRAILEGRGVVIKCAA